MKTHIFKTRVYYEDTDCGGVVYNANYLKFMERARSEWLIDLGLAEQDPAKRENLFVVRTAQIDIMHPARLYDQLQVESKIITMRHASFDFEHLIKSEQDLSLILCKGLIKIVCVNQAFKPQPIPQQLIEEIKSGS